AEFVMPEGQFDASDIHAHTIHTINFNIKKLRLTNIKAIQHDATKPYDKTYDKKLVDEPCSGLGLMRQKPEIKYTQSK
ncbi:16S rRNA (cytosine(967)-C(5))-methyltransferase RsmB, partial [Staphylococcus aureus]|nr:16S rRNA (cytosine(967)-C(5))-methyltransferase RsmB [Staphylococcus aureus]